IVFDCGKYKDAYKKLVTAPDDNLVIDLFNQSLVVKALEEKADAVLVLALAPVTAFTVQILKNAGIKTLHYFCEDLRAEEHWRPIIGVYDFFFVIQKDPWLKELRGLNPNTFYCPNGAPLEHMNDGTLPREHDTVFVGAPYQNRILFLEKLSAMGVDFRIWGWGWDQYPLSAELKKKVVNGTRWLAFDEIVTLYSRARIVLNLHSTLTGAEVETEGDFVNPRLFTVPMCRALQITDRRKAVFDFFEEDKEVVCFSSLPELAKKIDYFLHNPDHAQRIIDAAYKKTQGAHLLSTRLSEMLAIVFPERTQVTLDGQIAGVKSRQRGGQQLTDDDMLFLLADNIRTQCSSEE
ncbi:MAG: glycosyltransferase, partial [Fibrobacterota bacterium]